METCAMQNKQIKLVGIHSSSELLRWVWAPGVFLNHPLLKPPSPWVATWNRKVPCRAEVSHSVGQKLNFTSIRVSGSLCKNCFPQPLTMTMAPGGEKTQWEQRGCLWGFQKVGPYSPIILCLRKKDCICTLWERQFSEEEDCWVGGYLQQQSRNLFLWIVSWFLSLSILSTASCHGPWAPWRQSSPLSCSLLYPYACNSAGTQ